VPVGFFGAILACTNSTSYRKHLLAEESSVSFFCFGRRGEAGFSFACGFVQFGGIEGSFGGVEHAGVRLSVVLRRFAVESKL